MSDETTPQTSEGPRQLSRSLRRVIGVLIEKAFTTPDQYPLTVKATTNACNQKSNRDPVTNYNEDQIQKFLDDLRGLGLAAVVHTESGRTERFRHYVRKAYPFSEAQIAIIGELFLRGRQQPGELRTRASRMVPIESQEALRAELTGLLEGGYIQANGPLDRRGVEVDHNFYLPEENKTLAAGSFSASEPAAIEREPVSSPRHDEVVAELTDRVNSLEATVRDLADQLDAMKRELGMS